MLDLNFIFTDMMSSLTTHRLINGQRLLNPTTVFSANDELQQQFSIFSKAIENFLSFAIIFDVGGDLIAKIFHN